MASRPTNARSHGVGPTYLPNGSLSVRNRNGASLDVGFEFRDPARPHAPTHRRGVALSYDKNGNTLFDTSRTMAFDEANRLERVVRGGGPTDFAYGPDGARAKKTGAFTATMKAVRSKTQNAPPRVGERLAHSGVRKAGSEGER